MKKSGIQKFFIYTCIFTGSLIFLSGIIYKFSIPFLVNNAHIISYAEKRAEEVLGADINIQNPSLKTGSTISFKVDKVTIDKGNKNLLTLSDFDFLVSLKEIFNKKIIVKKLLAKDIYVDAYNLTKILPNKEKEEKEKKESFFTIDMYNILMGVKNCEVEYNSPEFNLDFKAKHAIFDRTQSRKFLHFDFDFYLQKDGHEIKVSANDQNRIFMEDGKAYVKDFPIVIDKSNIIINALATREKYYELNVSAKNFNANDIANIVNSNIIVANGSQMLQPVKNITGSVDFNVKLIKTGLSGDIKINNVDFNVIPLLDMPVKITSGNVKIGEQDIDFKDFKGFYNNKSQNVLKLEGYTKDYKKTCETLIKSDIFVTNDFFKNYLSKMLGSPIQIVGDSNSKLIIKSKNGSFDILWFFLLRENHGFKFGEQSMVLKDYKTFFKVDLSIIKNILQINTINYYITKEMKRGMTPLLKLDGHLDMADNMKILDLNLDMPRPLPSEFLNFLACQKIFKKGNVSGNISIDNHGIVPTMSGIFTFDKVLIPAQRMFIKSANLTAKGNTIDLKSEGRFRRSSYKFDGTVLNELKLPIIVKNVNLTVDDVDVEKILTQPSASNPEASNDVKQALVSTGEENEENKPAPEFVKGIVIVEKCGLNLIKGVYKEIKFGNLHADMTLDKDGILKLQSNKFDIADGISTLKVNADLLKKKYYLRLGVKDVDSNIMASAILGLPRQITGKAQGLIELNADETLKLNGDIKFRIKDGTIEQVGYVEYILKVASLFRNPLAMISPSLVMDLVNIPDGRFEEIYGEMKLDDNIIKRMKIESSASELATFIIGRYDLNTNDAMLRVYTKFSDKGKGFAGALRNISLNTLATKISISARNESNYYANELSMIPKLKTGEERAQVFLTKIDGDIINLNFLSSLKRIK